MPTATSETAPREQEAGEKGASISKGQIALAVLTIPLTIVGYLLILLLSATYRQWLGLV